MGKLILVGFFSLLFCNISFADQFDVLHGKWRGAAGSLPPRPDFLDAPIPGNHPSIVCTDVLVDLVKTQDHFAIRTLELNQCSDNQSRSIDPQFLRVDESSGSWPGIHQATLRDGEKYAGFLQSQVKNFKRTPPTLVYVVRPEWNIYGVYNDDQSLQIDFSYRKRPGYIEKFMLSLRRCTGC